MDETIQQLIQLLESRYGVDPKFSATLMPLLYAAMRADPDAREIKLILEGIVAAFGARKDAEAGSIDEVHGILSQFSQEMRKLDEALKVLTVYLDRVRKTVRAPSEPRTIH